MREALSPLQSTLYKKAAHTEVEGSLGSLLKEQPQARACPHRPHSPGSFTQNGGSFLGGECGGHCGLVVLIHALGVPARGWGLPRPGQSAAVAGNAALAPSGFSTALSDRSSHIEASCGRGRALWCSGPPTPIQGAQPCCGVMAQAEELEYQQVWLQFSLFLVAEKLLYSIDLVSAMQKQLQSVIITLPSNPSLYSLPPHPTSHFSKSSQNARAQLLGYTAASLAVCFTHGSGYRQ